MSKRLSEYTKWAIVGIWLCLVSILIYRHYIAGVEFTPLQSLSASQFKTSEEWFGIYLQNRKIGYMKSTSEKIGDEYRFIQSIETSVQRDGKSYQSSMQLKCLTDPDYRMKTFEFESQSDRARLKASGELDETNILLVFTETGGQKETHTLETQGQLYCPITVKPMLYNQGLEKGKRFRIPVLNILAMKVEDTAVEVQELIPVKLGINVFTAYKLKIGELRSWLIDGGRTLKEEPMSGLIYYSEIESSAKSEKQNPVFDFLSLPVLQSETKVARPEDLSSAKIHISGLKLSDYPLLDEGRQVVKGDVVEIQKENINQIKESNYDLPYRGSDFDAFLGPTRFVQSDHETIMQNARKFIDIEKNAFRMTRYLAANIYLSLVKRPLFHLRPAMEIFKIRAGESHDHTVMFTSFARAAGLPTRMVGGLVYLHGQFYYHTWVEIWFDKWVPADPTLGQFPADVLHIRMIEGDIDKLTAVGRIMKDLKIDIVGAL